MTWNPGNPTTSNAVLSDVPDIKENIYELALMGINRPIFTYNGGSSAATIKLKAGYYHCKDKFCYWVNELTTTQAASGTPTLDTWYYLYLDYSAITDGTAITNGELIWSTTAPTFNGTYRGWYNSDDRCIFACLANGAGNNFLSFYNDGGDYVAFDDPWLNSQVGGATSSYSAQPTLTIPEFATKARVTFNAYFSTTPTPGAYNYFWRTLGSSGTGNLIGQLISEVDDVNELAATLTDIVFTDSSQQIDFGSDTDTAGDSIQVITNGWFLPSGM